MNAPHKKISLRDWISGTKVVDKTGKPLILYHGTNQLFDLFDESQDPMISGTIRGFYFTSNKSAAQEYGKNLMVTLVNLKNPFVGVAKDEYREAHGLKRPGFGSSPEVFAQDKAVTPQVIKAWLVEKGHDGIIVPSGSSYFDHDEVIAFYAYQIRVIQTITPGMIMTSTCANNLNP